MNLFSSETLLEIPPRSTVMAPGYCNQMFDGKTMAMPCHGIKAEGPKSYTWNLCKWIIVKIKAVTLFLTCSLTLAM